MDSLYTIFPAQNREVMNTVQQEKHHIKSPKTENFKNYQNLPRFNQKPFKKHARFTQIYQDACAVILNKDSNKKERKTQANQGRKTWKTQLERTCDCLVTENRE